MELISKAISAKETIGNFGAAIYHRAGPAWKGAVAAGKGAADIGVGMYRSPTLWGAMGSRGLMAKMALPALMVGGFGLYGAFSNLIGESYSMRTPDVSYLPSNRSMLSGPSYSPMMSFRRDLNATGGLTLALHNQRKA